MPFRYTVERHGGQPRNRWRVVAQVDREEHADTVVEHYQHFMKRGAVRVIDEDTKEVIRFEGAKGKLPAEWIGRN